VLALIVIGFIRVAAGQLTMAIASRPEVDAQFSLLESAQPQSDVELPTLGVRTPDVVRTPEFGPDPTYWANADAASFYGLKSVRGHFGEP
jgi:hypothetical protein